MSPQTSSRVQPVDSLAGAVGYTRQQDPRPIDLFLDGNEGPPCSLEDLPLVDLQRYPDAGALEAALAQRWGLDPAQVIVTAGGDDAIDRVCRSVLAPGRSLVLPSPTFGMIPRYARLAGGEVREVPWPDGPYPLDAVLAACDETTTCIAVVSPNNPTGAVASGSDLRRLAESAPGALLLVDAAYAEFADEDLSALALELPNALVVRTFSKAWGLAGLRVGYALGPAEIVGWLRAVGQPYAVARPSLALAASRLEQGEDLMQGVVSRVRLERTELIDLLRELGAQPQPSQGNFVLARFQDPAWVRDALAGLGISVRGWPGTPGLDDALRITCPAEQAGFERLCAALRTAMAPEALLFDMDGVLADVTGSYREAILSTAASFGVTLSDAEIAAAKAAGDANDDWVLTRRLLLMRGVDAPLDEVTTRFEERYQGGLWRAETLRVDPQRLARLAERFPLAIVTGRPRADALRFLESQGIASLFRLVVAREDAPALKPDPAPVRAALEGLGVQRAWMVGDTPDDLRSASAAGVLPLGTLAPGDTFSEALLSAGAARVLTAPLDLETLL